MRALLINRYKYPLLVIMLNICILAMSVKGNITVQMQSEGSVFNIAPANWLASFSLITSSDDGEKLLSFTLLVKGMQIDDIQDAAIFSRQDAFFASLVHDPFDWKMHPTRLEKTDDGQIVATLIEPLAVSDQLKNQKDYLIAFKLAQKFQSKKFSVTLKQIQFSKSRYDCPINQINCRIDATPPHIKLMAKKLQLPSGITELKLQVLPTEKLLYPPQVSIQFSKGQKNIIDSHSWPIRHYGTPMKANIDGSYEYKYLFLSRLTDNLEPEKKITYTCAPAPDHWEWRKDNTGYDLLDGDARYGAVAFPGGLRWLHTNNVELQIDLKDSFPVGALVLYAKDYPERFSVYGSKNGRSNWVHLGDMQGQQYPVSQYGGEYSMFLADAIFPELPRLRFLKVKIFCRSSLIISEVVVYGLKPGEKPLQPDTITIYLCDQAGNRSELTKRGLNNVACISR
jgi:hypothetical protein